MSVTIQLPSGQRAIYDRPIILIGQDASCDIRLANDRRIQLQHAKLRRVASRWMIESQGDWPVQAGCTLPGRACWLQPGDVIRLNPNGPDLVFEPPAEHTTQAELLGLSQSRSSPITRGGSGVSMAGRQAVTWLQKAAEQGTAQAQCDLGDLYAKGDGVPKDRQQAIAWYRKAAEQECAQAQYNLGVAYANGDGVIRDSVQAYMWLNLAAAKGIEDAATVRQVLESNMSPAQIEKAQGMCRDFEAARQAKK